MQPIIYLDMDGVCCDFPKAVIQAYGQNPAEVFAVWEQENRGKFHDYQIMGLKDVDFWKAADHDKESFWTSIEEYPWFSTLYEKLSAMTTVLFLSSAGNSPAALSGKLKWLQARFGTSFHDYIFTLHKDRLAKSNTILIDDYTIFVDNFRQAGGKAVLFPQIWGANHHIDDKLSYTLSQVAELIELP